MPDDALQFIPVPVDPGSFSIESFQFGNVFNVAHHNKIFVTEIKESEPRKTIAFEMVLAHKSAYYMANITLILANITYLCFFVSWVPADKEGNSMETGTRLQNVTAMVLTAVTFKNQISYLTMLDSYVFVCFMVTSLVTVENALYPFARNGLARCGTGIRFSFILYCRSRCSILSEAYLRRWIKRRRCAAQVLMQVHEYIRVITDAIPARHRANVLRRFLDIKKYDNLCQPQFVITSNGDIHVQSPTTC